MIIYNMIEEEIRYDQQRGYAGADRTKNLKLAKTVPFADTNKNLKKYEFASEAQKPGSMWQLLMAMKECGFLFPTFTDRSGDLNHVNVYQKNIERPHMELVENILGVE